MERDGQLERVGDRGRLTFTRSLRARAREGVARAHRDRATRRRGSPTDARSASSSRAARCSSAASRPTDRRSRARCSPSIRRSVLEFMWGDDTLRFELQPDGDGTVLTFTDTFDEYGKAARDGAGWHACLDMLGYALDGTTPAGDNGPNWREVHAGYIEQFGPEASTIGPPEGHA